MKVSGTSAWVSKAASPQKKSDDQPSPSQVSTRVQNQQKVDALKEPERAALVEQKQRQTEKFQPQEAGRLAHDTDTGNGGNASVIAGKSFAPQPTSNSYEIEKIGKGSVVALDCSKNVKGALQVVAEIGDPPNAVVFKNVSSRDIFLVAGAKRVDGYGSEAITIQPGKEHKIDQLRVDRNYNYGEWYAVYSDNVAARPIGRNSETPSADQMHCLNRVNEIMAHRVLMGKKLVCRMLEPLILIGKCSSVDGCNSGIISRWIIHLNSSAFLTHIPSRDFVRRAMFLVCSATRKLVSSLLPDAKKNRLQHMRLLADGLS